MPENRRHENEVPVDEALVRRLLEDQFPPWAGMSLRLVEPSGTDHTIFRLGEDMSVRFPIVEHATRQAAREARWLPFLAPQLPLTLPVPLAMGEPGRGYPWNWSVVPWIDGDRVTSENVDVQAAQDLAAFVRALQACDPTDGPPAGPDTGQRGLSIHVWVDIVERYTVELKGDPLVARGLDLWQEVLEAPEWDGPPTWFHGDLSGNLISRNGKLVGAIDSGYGVGDPACDLMSGWTLFRGEAREVFFAEVGMDEAARTRARGWALGPALISVGYYRGVPHLPAMSRGAIEGPLDD